MVTVDPVMYRALERESAGQLPPGLRSWMLEVLMSGLPYADRMRQRDEALQAAAGFLGEGLSVAEQARQLRAAMLKASRAAMPANPQPDSLAGCLALALLARDRVPDERQIRNILDGKKRKMAV
ncbi:hypothetical protein [Archangium lansingense]|uniref:Uncharacterized protein n=1 Tax=Archangium lansingense TaxID=2995310 RepID=A0ABT4AB21_9BACT|nr:hypothetical protein [Archangium lansinium]MCY1078873.1 hypothetical protein [Archangium lansinium]